jgi:hypothetical protein
MTTFLSRREAMKAGALTGAGVALGGWAIEVMSAQGASGQESSTPGSSLQDMPMITKAIPSTGEKIPVIGLGTNQYGVDSDDEIAPRREVLKRLPELGGKEEFAVSVGNLELDREPTGSLRIDGLRQHAGLGDLALPLRPYDRVDVRLDDLTGVRQ